MLSMRPASGPGHYLRDTVYGAIDGVVTTLAIIAAVAGAGLSPLVALVLGIANLVADGISMGASNYLGLKSELEQTGRSVKEEMPIRHGMATFGAFVVAGVIPLVAYLAPFATDTRFVLALVFGGVTLFGVGALRAPFTRRGVMWSGGEMLLVGGAASLAAYGIGALAQRVVGI